MCLDVKPIKTLLCVHTLSYSSRKCQLHGGSGSVALVMWDRAQQTDSHRALFTSLPKHAGNSRYTRRHEHTGTEREKKITIISSAVIRSRECKHIEREKRRAHVTLFTAMNMFFPLQAVMCLFISVTHTETLRSSVTHYLKYSPMNHSTKLSSSLMNSDVTFTVTQTPMHDRYFSTTWQSMQLSVWNVSNHWDRGQRSKLQFIHTHIYFI